MDLEADALPVEPPRPPNAASKAPLPNTYSERVTRTTQPTTTPLSGQRKKERKKHNKVIRGGREEGGGEGRYNRYLMFYAQSTAKFISGRGSEGGGEGRYRYLMFYAQSTAKGHIRGETKCTLLPQVITFFIHYIQDTDIPK